MRDAYSRDARRAERMIMKTGEASRLAFERLVEEHGLPESLLVENGSPFVSKRSPGGRTTLSAWSVSLGIRLMCGRPACPTADNGHKRWHLAVRVDVEGVATHDLDGYRAALLRGRQELTHVRQGLGHEGAQQALQSLRAAHPGAQTRSALRRAV